MFNRGTIFILSLFVLALVGGVSDVQAQSISQSSSQSDFTSQIENLEGFRRFNTLGSFARELHENPALLSTFQAAPNLSANVLSNTNLQRQLLQDIQAADGDTPLVLENYLRRFDAPQAAAQEGQNGVRPEDQDRLTGGLSRTDGNTGRTPTGSNSGGSTGGGLSSGSFGSSSGGSGGIGLGGGGSSFGGSFGNSTVGSTDNALRSDSLDDGQSTGDIGGASAGENEQEVGGASAGNIRGASVRQQAEQVNGNSFRGGVRSLNRSLNGSNSLGANTGANIGAPPSNNGGINFSGSNISLDGGVLNLGSGGLVIGNVGDGSGTVGSLRDTSEQASENEQTGSSQDDANTGSGDDIFDGDDETTEQAEQDIDEIIDSDDETTEQAAQDIDEVIDSDDDNNQVAQDDINDFLDNEGEDGSDSRDNDASDDETTEQAAQDIENALDGEPTNGPDTWLAFVTSEKYTGDLGGLSGADEKCNTLATDAGHQTEAENKFMAWLSDSQEDSSPKNTFANVGTSDPFVRTDGIRIAEDWEELTSGELRSTLALDENEQPTSGRKWTSTRSDGSFAGASPSSLNCQNWADGTRNSDGSNGGEGNNTDEFWTTGARSSCDQEFSLYCFQVLREGSITPRGSAPDEEEAEEEESESSNNCAPEQGNACTASPLVQAPGSDFNSCMENLTCPGTLEDLSISGSLCTARCNVPGRMPCQGPCQPLDITPFLQADDPVEEEEAVEGESEEEAEAQETVEEEVVENEPEEEETVEEESQETVGSWETTDWRACSRQCGSGTQTRDVFCDFDRCEGEEPASEQSCNTQSCPQTRASSNGSSGSGSSGGRGSGSGGGKGGFR